MLFPKFISCSLPSYLLFRCFLSKNQYFFTEAELIKSHTDIFTNAKRISICAGRLTPEFFGNEGILSASKLSLDSDCEVDIVYDSTASQDDWIGLLHMADGYDNIHLFDRQTTHAQYFVIIERNDDSYFIVLSSLNGSETSLDERNIVILANGYDDVLVKFKDALAVEKLKVKAT